MPDPLSDQLLDLIVERSVALLRLEAQHRREVARILVSVQSELIGRLANADLTGDQRARLNRLLSEVKQYLGETYTSIAQQQAQHAFELMQAEALFVVDAINARAGFNLMAKLSTDVLRALATDLLIQGAPSAEWWARQAADTTFQFATQMRLGIAQGETIGELVRRIRGAPTKGIAGIMPVARRNAEALVRSSVATVLNAARLGVYKANADVLAGVQQISTLDGRTTPVCIAYSGAVWDLEGKPIRGTTLPFNGGPPRHWNCRSTLLPVTKTFRELGINRDEVPAGTRASMDGQVAADLSFADWLKRKPQSFQDDLLGPGRADLWRDGKITLQQLLDATGRELTLDELHKRFGG